MGRDSVGRAAGSGPADGNCGGFGPRPGPEGERSGGWCSRLGLTGSDAGWERRQRGEGWSAEGEGRQRGGGRTENTGRCRGAEAGMDLPYVEKPLRVPD